MKKIKFALNRIVAPRLSLEQFLDMTQALGLDAVELRNDLQGVEILQGTNYTAINKATSERGISVITINALQKFNFWNEERVAEATTLAKTAQQCGAQALVLCPVNSTDDQRDAKTRYQDTVIALNALAPILKNAGLVGLVEPLGFEICSLRHKAVVSDILKEVVGDFKMVHDTFHHHLSGDTQFYPKQTQLVHISGVTDSQLTATAMNDGHRVLIDAADRLGNVQQIKQLLDAGYQGYFSFEPFAESVHKQSHSEIQVALQKSMDYMNSAVFSA